MAKQFIYALSGPDRPGDVRYIGRTNDLDTRLSSHCDWPLDGTVRDAWLTHFKSAGLQPNMSVLEDRDSSVSAELEAWAKSRESHFIKRFFADGADLMNGNVFWNHPCRKTIPKSLRSAWCILHEIIARIDFDSSFPGDHLFHEITRFRAFVAVRSLCEEYAWLAIAPLEWLERKTSIQ